MENIELVTLVLLLLALYLFYDSSSEKQPNFDQIARECWKTPSQVKREYEASKKNKDHYSQIGGYIDAITNTRDQQYSGLRNRRVGQREGQVCNSKMPCHYGLDCYQGVCVVPKSNNFYSDFDS